MQPKESDDESYDTSDDDFYDTSPATGYVFSLTQSGFYSTVPGAGAEFRNEALKDYMMLQMSSSRPSRSAWLLSAVQMGRCSREVLVTFHPAEASGASSNPKLQVMGLPREVRDKIFGLATHAEHDIQMYFWKQTKNDSFGSLSSNNCALQQTSVYGCKFARDFKNSDGSDPRGLFLVSKRAYAESHPLFYSRNHFHFADASTNFCKPLFQQFNEDPRGTLSAINASLIKNVMIDMESLILARTESQSLIEPLVMVVSHFLPGLQSLRLSREINNGRRSRQLRPEREYDGTFDAEDIAFTLRIAARIAKGHPVLSKIVWEAGTDRVWFAGRMDGCVIHSPTLGTGLYIKVMPASYDTKVPEIRMDARRNILSIKNTTLDGDKILQTSWKDFGRWQVSDYALDKKGKEVMKSLLDPTAKEFRM
ncbi:hypothetical protein H2200_007219 [Cladophialophora chaetospira]|uniref:Uncharacterized protein n=1 Tax=Cladophialophora chaetospira TaxID=386627 RepID=A0AA39CGX0_9EURO|nr:hypothetical protein H2200_007219 [Cladophialophora chaetospira]